MATAAELKLLADERISEAEHLFANSKYAGVFYLAGYAIEFALKAVICERLGLEIFEFSNNNKPRQLSQKASSAFLTHNLHDLLILSGLKKLLEMDKFNNANLLDAWSEASQWSEQRRYDFSCDGQAADIFLNYSKILLAWIKNHW